jgi:predicted metal-binding membrane protein
MNLAWTAAITVVFVAEKNWRHGVGLTTLVAMTLSGLGVAVLFHPHLLGSVTFVRHGTRMSG